MSTLKIETLSKLDGSASVPTDTVVNGTAKAWVNFNGTGTVAIRAAFNVSSITDGGVGIYTVNFTTPMVDANYAVTLGGDSTTSGGAVTAQSEYSDSYTTTTFRMRASGSTGAAVDWANCNATVFR